MPVNRKGFVSMYALMLIQSVLLASLLLLSSAAANGSANADMALFDAQIVSAYRIKARLHAWKEYREEKNKESEEKVDIGEESANPYDEIDVIYEESFYHDDLSIAITYWIDHCDVMIDHMNIRVYYQIEDESILDMVYL